MYVNASYLNCIDFTIFRTGMTYKIVRKRDEILAVTKIHAIKTTTSKALIYIENPAKTEGQLLVSAYNTEPQTAAIDFEITASAARKAKGTNAKSPGNLAYHLIQSFSPDDDLTPEQAHEIGKRLAMEFTDGKYEYVIATHVDKGHLHNHIIINAVSFYDYKKLRTVPYRTARQIRNISDRLCAEAELSVIGSPQQLGQQYSDYSKKRKQTPVRTEIRRRLNFCLDRATDYEQFQQMAAELGIQIKDGGKYVSYRYEGGKPVRDNKLADTDKYTVAGIKERLQSNRTAWEHIGAVLDGISPQATPEQRQEMLKQAGIQTKTNRRTGAVSYLAHEADDDWLPEDALPGTAATPLLERYKATVRTSPNTPDTLVTLAAGQIVKSTSRGLVVQTQDKNGNAAILMVEREQVEATPDGRVQIAIGSQFEYDITYPDDAHGALRGGELIRQIELTNHVEPVRVELTAEQIKSMSLKGVTVTLPQAGIERAFIQNEYVQRDKLAGTCAVLLYPNWDYSFVPTSDEKARQNMKGTDLAAALGRPIQTVDSGNSLRQRIAYVERKAQIVNAKHLAQTFQNMAHGGYKTADDFAPQLRGIQKEQQAVHAQISELEQKNRQYAVAARNLQTCATYGSLQTEYLQKNAVTKRLFFAKHKDALQAYQKASEQLESMGIHQTVEPEKVCNLIKATEQQIHQLQEQLATLREQEHEVLSQQRTVQEIQDREEEQHENTF